MHPPARRRLLSLVVGLAVVAAVATGCGSSPSTGPFCAASVSLTDAGTSIQHLSPNDVAQVKAQVAALVPEAQLAEKRAPKAIRGDVQQLGDALSQFAGDVARATTPQDLITAFSAYNDRARDLADPAQRVDSWVAAHCGGPAATPAS